MNKAETAKQYGAEQVMQWRRSYDIPPKALDVNDPRTSYADPRYTRLKREEIPLAECLKDTLIRVEPYWKDTIVPSIRAGKQIIISAHGNSLRALIKILDEISDEDIVSLNIPNGRPIVYELDENLKPIRHYYLGDQESLHAAVKAAASHGQSK